MGIVKKSIWFHCFNTFVLENLIFNYLHYYIMHEAEQNFHKIYIYEKKTCFLFSYGSALWLFCTERFFLMTQMVDMIMAYLPVHVIYWRNDALYSREKEREGRKTFHPGGLKLLSNDQTLFCSLNALNGGELSTAESVIRKKKSHIFVSKQRARVEEG